LSLTDLATLGEGAGDLLAGLLTDAAAGLATVGAARASGKNPGPFESDVSISKRQSESETKIETKIDMTPEAKFELNPEAKFEMTPETEFELPVEKEMRGAAITDTKGVRRSGAIVSLVVCNKRQGTEVACIGSNTVLLLF
jgi:hypothetical protein